MKILDRYVIVSFLKNYLISFMVLVGMYVVMDMVFKFEDFAQMQGSKGGSGYSAVLQMVMGMVDYYFYQCFMFFIQLSGIIPVLAAAFTLIRLSRFNELAAVLAAGVPLLRVAMPIIIVSVALNALLLIDQELVIPKLIPKLVRDPEDVQRVGPKKYPIQLMQDMAGGGLLNAGMYDPGPPPTLFGVEIQQRDEAGGAVHIKADQALWDGSAWSLVRARVVDPPANGKADVPRVFVTDLDPDALAKSGTRDPRTRELPINARDRKGDTLKAANFEPAAPPTMHIMDFIEQRDGVATAHITADKAVWDKRAKLWHLTNGKRVEVLRLDDKGPPETPVDRYQGGVDPAAIALYRTSDFVELLSTNEIDRLIKSGAYGQASLYRVKHFRFTQPLMNVVLLLLAIPCLLIREPGRVKQAITMCLVLCSVCMSGIFMSHQLAGQNTLGAAWANTWPAMMAWVPVFVFLPIAIWFLDRTHAHRS